MASKNRELAVTVTHYRKPGRKEHAAGRQEPSWNLDRFVLRLLWFLLKPRRLTWIPAGLFAAALMWGTPHVLVTYKCSNKGAKAEFCTRCDFYGLSGWQEFNYGNAPCELFRMYPLELGG